MAQGDLIVTLGTPGGEARGPSLGSIAAVSGSSAALTRSAEVTPAVDHSTLDRVAVLVPDPPTGRPVVSTPGWSRGAWMVLMLVLGILAIAQVSLVNHLPTPWAVPDPGGRRSPGRRDRAGGR